MNKNRLIEEFVDRWYLPEEDSDSPDSQESGRLEMIRQMTAIVDLVSEDEALEARVDEVHGAVLQDWTTTLSYLRYRYRELQTKQEEDNN